MLNHAMNSVIKLKKIIIVILNTIIRVATSLNKKVEMSL